MFAIQANVGWTWGKGQTLPLVSKAPARDTLGY
jgi:hypothetical protein